jgi:hypothetical protein
MVGKDVMENGVQFAAAQSRDERWSDENVGGGVGKGEERREVHSGSRMGVCLLGGLAWRVSGGEPSAGTLLHG